MLKLSKAEHCDFDTILSIAKKLRFAKSETERSVKTNADFDDWIKGHLVNVPADRNLLKIVELDFGEETICDMNSESF